MATGGFPRDGKRRGNAFAAIVSRVDTLRCAPGERRHLKRTTGEKRNVSRNAGPAHVRRVDLLTSDFVACPGPFQDTCELPEQCSSSLTHGGQ